MTFKSLKFYLSLMGLWKRGEHYDLVLNLVFLGFFINFVVSSLWFFLFTAQTIIEFSKCFYYMMSAFLVLAWYSIYLYQRNEYAQVFVDLDTMMEKSKPMIQNTLRKKNGRKSNLYWIRKNIIQKSPTLMEKFDTCLCLCPLIITTWLYSISFYMN